MNAAHCTKSIVGSYHVIDKIMLSCLSLPCSKNHNAIYGHSDMHAFLLAASIGGTYMESVSKSLNPVTDGRVPSASLVRKTVSAVPEYTMLLNLMEGIDRTVSAVKKTGMLNGPVTVAIDKHLIPRYDRTDSPYIIRSKPRDGTDRFEGYACVQSVNAECRLMLGAVPVVKWERNDSRVAKLLESCLKNGVHVGLALLDREFFSINVINEIKNRGISFIMPAKKTPGIKDAVAEYVRGDRGAISNYVIRRGKSWASFTLVIMKNPKPNPKKDPDMQYLTYATNIPTGRISGNIGNVLGLYKKRWGIESAFSSIGEIRARTTSKNACIRLLLFYYALILFNAWIVANVLAKKAERRAGRNDAGGCDSAGKYGVRVDSEYQRPVVELSNVKRVFEIVILGHFCVTLGHYLGCVR